MRVALVNTSVLRGRGSDHVVSELAEGLSRTCTVTVFAPLGANLACGGVEIVGRGNEQKRGLSRLTSALRVIWVLRRRAGEFDVLNCHHAILSLLLPSRVLVTTYHGYTGRLHHGFSAATTARLRQLVRRTLVGPALRRSRISTAVSATLAEEVKSFTTGLEATVIHNGVSTTATMPKVGVEPGGYFLYCGRVDYDKAVDVLVRMYAKADTRVPLLLAGDGAIRSRLEREFGSSRIRFLGLKDKADLIELYRNALAFVTASPHETFCLPVIEAASLGRPSIGPRTGATKEVIQHGVTGLLVRDESEFADALGHIAALSERERKQMADCCIGWAAQFEWSRKVKEYLQVFRRVTEG